MAPDGKLFLTHLSDLVSFGHGRGPFVRRFGRWP
jgi:hypothetical protein